MEKKSSKQKTRHKFLRGHFHATNIYGYTMAKVRRNEIVTSTDDGENDLQYVRLHECNGDDVFILKWCYPT